MEVFPTKISDVLLIKPKVFRDTRGLFLETWQKERYRKHGVPTEYVQDNLSVSVKNTLRGLHFQHCHPQGKLITVLSGKIFDVVVDLRKDSETFGKWVGSTLNGETFDQMWIPPGFAHGFCVLSEQAVFNYKCTDYYEPSDERTLLWNDPILNIAWPITGTPIISPKDQKGTGFKELKL